MYPGAVGEAVNFGMSVCLTQSGVLRGACGHCRGSSVVLLDLRHRLENV